MGARYRLERVYLLIEQHGPIRPCDLARLLRLRSRMPVYKALQTLREQGRIVRHGVKPWWYTYTVAPGSHAPNDGRGLHPNSRRMVKPAASDWWRPCALAELLPFPLDR